MPTEENIKTWINSLRKDLDHLEKALAQLEHDASLGRTVRKLSTNGKRGLEVAVAVVKGKPGRKPGRKPGPKKKGKLITDEQILSAIRSKDKTGASSKEIAQVTGLSGEGLRVRLVKLRKANKVTVKGKTSKMRYFTA
jgi:hypothetical protein